MISFVRFQLEFQKEQKTWDWIKKKKKEEKRKEKATNIINAWMHNW